MDLKPLGAVAAVMATSPDLGTTTNDAISKVVTLVAVAVGTALADVIGSWVRRLRARRTTLQPVPVDDKAATQRALDAAKKGIVK